MLIVALGCQDYHLSSKDNRGGSSPGDSGESGAIDTVIDTSIDTSIDTTDSAPACTDIAVATARTWAGAPTCEAFEMSSWNLVIESDAPHGDDPETSAVANPIAVPVPGFGERVLYECENGAACGVDAATGIQDYFIPRAQGGYNGLAAATDQCEGTGWLGIASETAGADGAEAGQLSVARSDGGTALDWSSIYTPFLAPTAADLDADGYPDFVLDGVALDRSAAEMATWPTYFAGLYSTVVDLDGDARFEVIGSAGIMSMAPGTPFVEWSGLYPSEWRIFQGAAFQAGGEVLIGGSDEWMVFVAHPDGQVIWSVPYTVPLGLANAPIAIGDTTGDGVPEICAIIDHLLKVFDVNGTILWQEPHQVSGDGGCAMADLDANGVYEVIQWGPTGLHVRSGGDGHVLGELEGIRSFFAWNGPIIADVDGDGSAEIVVSGAYANEIASTQNRLFVVGPASGRWARTRPVWNQWAYDVTSIRDDGTIVSFPFAPWATYNAFRAQPAHDGSHPDLVIAATDACATTCDDAGLVRIAVQVSNAGSVEAPAGAVVRLYTWDDLTGLREDDSAVIPEPIPPGMSAAGVVLEVSRSAWGTRRVIEVVGSGMDECDWVNNREEIDIPDPCRQAG